MIFPHEFHMMSQEGNLAQHSLLSGIEAIGKLNYDKTGTFYAAFFQLSVGLERLMKIVVIIDHKSKNNLKNPSGKQIRNLGHDLVVAYEICKQLAADRGRGMAEWHESGSVEYKVLRHLSQFAKGARYYNLDSFSEQQNFDDPIVQWASIHHEIANQNISYIKQQKINGLALAHCDKFQMFGFERSITGEYRTQVDCTFMYELYRRANKYCIWTIVKILKPFYFLLRDICNEIREIESGMKIDHYTVPDMHEFFPFMLFDRSTSTRRQRWVGIY